MVSTFKRVLFFLRLQWPLLLGMGLVLLAFWIAFQFVDPPPPKRLTLAAGPAGGGYDYFARLYAEELARNGVEVKIVETRGSLHNMQMLEDPAGGIDVAFAQDGTGWMAGAYQQIPEESRIRSLAEIYKEPLWVFTRREKGFGALRDLKGRRLAVGPAGSGSNALAVDLLKWSGVTAGEAVFLELSQEEARVALQAGTVDVAFFIGGPGSSFLQRCAADPSLRLHSFGDAAAYIRRFVYLDAVTLPAGVLDLAKNVPPEDVLLLSPDAALLARKDLHPALVYLLLEAAKKGHGGHGLLADAGEFPSIRSLEFPLHAEAERYFKSGPPFLQRFLPYHLAAFIDRTKILLVPLLTLLLPLIKIAYPTYQWSVRRNIWKWYRQVSGIEDAASRGSVPNPELLQRLAELEAQVAKVHVPNAYASELYTLRHHVMMVRERIERDGAGKSA